MIPVRSMQLANLVGWDDWQGWKRKRRLSQFFVAEPVDGRVGCDS
jgi:hypothetical protein